MQAAAMIKACRRHKEGEGNHALHSLTTIVCIAHLFHATVDADNVENMGSVM